MEKAQIACGKFASIDIRIGTVSLRLTLSSARTPAYKVEVDFGDLGRKWSSDYETMARMSW